jgi:hypothetical protein
LEIVVVQGIAHRRKQYVIVLARFVEDGSITPLAI